MNSGPRLTFGGVIALFILGVVVWNGITGSGKSEEPTPTVAPTPVITQPPWPSSWAVSVCSGVATITSMADSFEALSDAADSLDLDAIAAESTVIAALAESAQGDFEAATGWPPGEPMVRQLRAVATNYARAASLWLRGANEVEPRAIEAGTELIAKAVSQLAAARRELAALQERYDFYCP